MSALINLQLIFEELLPACGVLALFYVIWGQLTRFNPKLSPYFNSLGILIAMAGIAWIAHFVFQQIQLYQTLISEEERNEFIRMWTGKYAFGFWFSPLLILVVTQIHWIKWIRLNTRIRGIGALLLITQSEVMLYMPGVVKRDTLPLNWRMYELSTVIFSLALACGLTLFLTWSLKNIRSKMKHETVDLT